MIFRFDNDTVMRLRCTAGMAVMVIEEPTAPVVREEEP